MSSRFRFRLTAGLGLGSIISMLVLFVFAGVAFPLHVAGLGDFFIAADSVAVTDPAGTTPGFALTPVIDPNGASTASGTGSPAADGPTPAPPSLGGGALGTGLVALENAAITNLTLQKRITVAPGVHVKATITGGPTGTPVTGSNVTISAGHICADTITLGNLVADDPGVNTATPLDDLSLTADTATIGGARIQATGLTAGTITIPSLQLKVAGGDYDAAFTTSCLAS